MIELRPEFSAEYPEEEAIRGAVADLVRRNRCWSTSPITKMVFTKISPSPALHYQLETYTESRQVKHRGMVTVRKSLVVSFLFRFHINFSIISYDVTILHPP